MPSSDPAAAQAGKPKKPRKLAALRGRQVGLADDEVLPIGTPISRYSISDEPIDGPAGPLYPARDAQSGEVVTLWPLPILLTRADGEILKAIQQEARRAARLEHPLLLRPINIGRERGVVYMVLEPYPADSLDDVAPLSAVLATHVIREVAEAVALLHQSNLLHRDLRPENLRLDPDGSLSLTGLGLVRAAEFIAQVRTGSPAIDPHYVGPELSPDRRSDVYSLGATYYFLLTGRRPFEGVPFEQLVEAHRSAAVPDPARFVPGMPPECGRIIRKAMAKNPRERFPEMVDFAAELRRLQEVLGPAELAGAEGGPLRLPMPTTAATPTSAEPTASSAAAPPAAAPPAAAPPAPAAAELRWSGVPSMGLPMTEAVRLPLADPTTETSPAAATPAASAPSPTPSAPVPSPAASMATQEVPRPLGTGASLSDDGLPPPASATVAATRPAGFGESYTSMALSMLARRSASFSGEISAPISTAGRTRASLSRVDVDAWMDLSDTLNQSTILGGQPAASDSAGSTASGRAAALDPSAVGPARLGFAMPVTPMSGSGAGSDTGSASNSAEERPPPAPKAPAPKAWSPMSGNVLSNSAEIDVSEEDLKVLSNSLSADIAVPPSKLAAPGKAGPAIGAPAKPMAFAPASSAPPASPPAPSPPAPAKPSAPKPAKAPKAAKLAAGVDVDFSDSDSEGTGLLGQAFFAAIMGFIMVAAVVLAALILTGRLRV